jgi:hypothetical protein
MSPHHLFLELQELDRAKTLGNESHLDHLRMQDHVGEVVVFLRNRRGPFYDSRDITGIL